MTLRGAGTAPNQTRSLVSSPWRSDAAITSQCCCAFDGSPVALLAILKDWRRHVPLDPDYPAKRVGFVLADLPGARARDNENSRGEGGQFSPAKIIALDQLKTELVSQPATRLTAAETGATPEEPLLRHLHFRHNRPTQGVQVEHRSVCHLVRAEAEIFQVRPEDPRLSRLLHRGSMPPVEEVWLALFVGATLVVGTGRNSSTPAAALSADVDRRGRDRALIRAHAFSR